MFKRIALICLIAIHSVYGMESNNKLDISHTAKQVIFWYINSMPAYRGLLESSEVLQECVLPQAEDFHAIDPKVITLIEKELETLKMPACTVSVRKQTKPLMAGYKTICLDTDYYTELAAALEQGSLSDEQQATLRYHFYRASVYMSSYMKPKCIALAFAVPAVTGITCQYINQYLPQEGISSWIIMLIQACASSTLNLEVIQRFLDHMQTAADNAVPNDPAILKAGIQYLKHHSDPEKLSRRLSRIAAFEKRLRAMYSLGKLN